MVGADDHGPMLSQADAHLIAAAPEFYAALSELLKYHATAGVFEPGGLILEQGHAALAKGRGERGN